MVDQKRRIIVSVAATFGFAALGLALVLVAGTLWPAGAAWPSSPATQPGPRQGEPTLAAGGTAGPRNARTGTATTTVAGGYLAAEPFPTATPAGASGLPAQTVLAGVPLGKQALSLSCEFQSASDLATYYGKPQDWQTIYDLVGNDPGGNPHRGFAGSGLDDPPGRLYPEGYGVYAEPIAQALRTFGLEAEVHYWEPGDWLRHQVAAGRPVMIWAPHGMLPATVVQWTATDGVPVRGARGEHSYLVVGYDEDRVWVNDPWDGRQKTYVWEVFLKAWDTFDRMAIVIGGAPPDLQANAVHR